VFAIQQSTGSFIVPEYVFGNQGPVINVVVSKRAKMYKTAEDADARCAAIEKFLDESTESLNKTIADIHAKRSELEAKIANINRKITELEVRPYVEVVDKIAKLNKDLKRSTTLFEHQKWALDVNDQSLDRLVKIREQPFTVVELVTVWET
jgi:peptidoglycan hydrolase CwlO-like protein